MSMPLSQRVQNMQGSLTMAQDAKVKELKALGEPVINLTAGEPDFLPPQQVLDATCQATELGLTKYTIAKGTLELRKAISQRFEKIDQLDYNFQDQVLVTNGGKEAIFLALASVVDPGDEVIILKPYWTSYAEMVKLCEGEPVFFDLKNDLSGLENLITKKTKALILNSPNNPTGKVFSLEELEQIAQVLNNKNIWLIADEIYSLITFEPNVHKSIAHFTDCQRKTVVINGVSKSHAMTGYRIGYAVGPAEIIGAMSKLKSQISGCPNSISQHASVVALNLSLDVLQKMSAVYEKRMKELITPFVAKMNLEYFPLQGAFYLFFKLPAKYTDDVKFCQDLLEQEKFGLVPGAAFGYPGWVRLSYAASDDDLQEGLSRLERFING